MSEVTSYEELLREIGGDSFVEKLSGVNFNAMTKNHELVSIKDYNTKNAIALSMVLANTGDVNGYNHSYVHNMLLIIDSLIEAQVNTVLANKEFRYLEKEWLKIQELCSVSYDSIEVSILDVSKEELHSDINANVYDISSSSFFKKVYVDEFDQYGGEPFGTILGMHEIENNEDDISLLTGLGLVAKTTHAPYIGSIDSEFFGMKDYSQVSEIKSFETLLEHPKYTKWNAFRELDVAAYIGLTVGDFILRSPYHPENNPISHKELKGFAEQVDYTKDDNYRWSPASVKFVKNMMRSYDKTRWFQYTRGVENGGLVENLVSVVYEDEGILETKNPLNAIFSDYMELSLSRIGFIPFIAEKGTRNATFFSVNSMKKVNEFVDDFDSANSQMVANISYTMCISRISHFIKTVIRNKIGSVVNAELINSIITGWLNNYITSVFNPTPLEMGRFPFRYGSVEVKPIPGKPGWFNSKIIVIPHIQFEGMLTEMVIDTKLDPSIFE